jgi:D-glycero-alpha-D-manno-heptose-7-phosphate kinase
MDTAVRSFDAQTVATAGAPHPIVRRFVAIATPLRVSFFGGGTDYPEYFSREKGAVLGMALNHHVHIAAQRRPAFLERELQISYSRTERVTSAAEIEHAAIRAAFGALDFDDPVDLSILAALPSQTGLGSSGAFMVGLVNAISRLQGRPLTPMALAKEAIRIEREVLGHVCGVQDQLHAAFGGWNCFQFSGEDIVHRPVCAPVSAMDQLTGSMYLVFTGQTRSAPRAVAAQLDRTVKRQIDRELALAYDLVERGLAILERADEGLVADFGALLHEAWVLKRKFSAVLSNDQIDGLYARGLSHGAIGGKLCGAGGGGFLLFVVPKDRRAEFASAFAGSHLIKVETDWRGSWTLEG